MVFTTEILSLVHWWNTSVAILSYVIFHLKIAQTSVRFYNCLQKENHLYHLYHCKNFALKKFLKTDFKNLINIILKTDFKNLINIILFTLYFYYIINIILWLSLLY